MWFGQTGSNMNQFETDLSASVNGTPTVEKILY